MLCCDVYIYIYIYVISEKKIQALISAWACMSHTQNRNMLVETYTAESLWQADDVHWNKVTHSGLQQRQPVWPESSRCCHQNEHSTMFSRCDEKHCFHIHHKYNFAHSIQTYNTLILSSGFFLFAFGGICPGLWKEKEKESAWLLQQ